MDTKNKDAFYTPSGVKLRLLGLREDWICSHEREVREYVHRVFVHNKYILDHLEALEQGTVPPPPDTDELDSIAGRMCLDTGRTTI